MKQMDAFVAAICPYEYYNERKAGENMLFRDYLYIDKGLLTKLSKQTGMKYCDVELFPEGVDCL